MQHYTYSTYSNKATHVIHVVRDFLLTTDTWNVNITSRKGCWVTWRDLNEGYDGLPGLLCAVDL